MRVFLSVFLVGSAAAGVCVSKAQAAEVPSNWSQGFHWTSSAPLIAPVPPIDKALSLKDPSVVYAKGRWHVFATVKAKEATYMEYLSFKEWPEAQAAPRKVISLTPEYHCAPEVFYFTPKKKWYLIYQASIGAKGDSHGPVYSTLEDIDRPDTLTAPVLMIEHKPANVTQWIDFWVICDDENAYMFFTGDDGSFWRSETAKTSFPMGWTAPEKIKQDEKNEFFEAGHIYRLEGLNQYLLMVEARRPTDQRYYKAYLADRLDGAWTPLAATWDKPFASILNVDFAPGVEPWTDSVSHGELIREGFDETPTVDPSHLQFLYQGCSAADRAGKKYAAYPWRIGMLVSR